MVRDELKYMSTEIHPYLLARLLSVQAAFGKIELRLSILKNSAAVQEPIVSENDSNDEKGGSGGNNGSGGGTAKGLRGKNSEYAKAAMRKLMRR